MAREGLKRRTKRNKLKSFCKSSLNYGIQFCEITTIQGPAYIVRNVSLFERLWWVMIFILGISGSCIMVYQISEKYVTTPVLVSLATKERMIRDIPFPAVTICPQSKIATRCVNYTDILLARRSGNIMYSDIQQNEYYDYMSLLCKSDNHEGAFSILNKSISREDLGNSSDVNHLLDLISLISEIAGGFFITDYSDFLKNCSTVDLQQAYCQWMGKKVNCADVLSPIITEKGLCYTFNMYDVRDIYSDLNDMKYFPEGVRKMDWFPEKGYKPKLGDTEDIYPRKSYLSGARNAFVAVFYTHKDDINYACEDFAIQGMQVTLHTPTKIPRTGRVFFSIGLDSMTNAAVSPSFTETSDAIKHYAPEQRFCYYENERKLKYFKFYSQSNCNFECFVNYTINQCGCANFYMPRDNKTRVCELKERYCLESARAFYADDILEDKLRNAEPDNTTSDCRCLPLCADLTYNADITQSEWYWNNEDEIELDDYNKTETDMYHASAVRVYFKDAYFLPSIRNELYGTTDMISNIGGILSLFVGVSLITSAEIIYFSTLKLLDNYCRYGHCFGKQK